MLTLEAANEPGRVVWVSPHTEEIFQRAGVVMQPATPAADPYKAWGCIVSTWAETLMLQGAPTRLSAPTFDATDDELVAAMRWYRTADTHERLAALTVLELSGGGAFTEFCARQGGACAPEGTTC